MIHALRRVARAIRRRPVWLLLTAYVLAAWAVVELVHVGMLWLGLPAWTPGLAVVLLMAMLPLMVATAVLRGGLPGLRIQDETDPNELIGLTPEQVHVVPEAHPLHGWGILTWRNMVLGGVSSAALLVTSVVAYMTMWAFGIGPVGSLMARGLIGKQDVVALAHFENRTDDPSLGALVADAVALELSRSWIVAPLDGGASDVRIVVSGTVARSRSGYGVTSSIALPSGAVLARFEESSAGDGDLLIAVERLTERVRERMGESLRTIREGERLAPITTRSEEALRLYTEAGRLSTAGDVAGAMELLESSVRVDPSFAMAWRRLGVLAEEAGNPEQARGAYQRVVDLWAPSGRAVRTVEQMRERISALE